MQIITGRHILRCRLCGQFVNRNDKLAHMNFHGNNVKTVFDEMVAAVEPFSREDKHFIKFFLLDDSINLNEWGVTEAAIKRRINTFLGKPFVVTEDLGHPSARNADELLRIQEKYRVGTIIDVGFDENTSKAFAVAEITNEKAWELISQGEVRFVSPAISFDDKDVFKEGDADVLRDFLGLHVAGVKDPAFGVVKAQIKGQCSGEEEHCIEQLEMVQASCVKCGSVTHTTYKAITNITQITEAEAIKLGPFPNEHACRIRQPGEFQPDSFRRVEQDDLVIIIGKLKGESATTTQAFRYPKDKWTEDRARKHCEEHDGIRFEPATDEEEGSSLNAKCSCSQSEMPEDNSILENKVKELEAKLTESETARTESEKKYTELKDAFEAERKKPLINKITSAKQELGSLAEDKVEEEKARLAKRSFEDLEAMAIEYDNIAKAKKELAAEPKVIRYRSASRDTVNDSDKLIAELRGGA